MKDVEYMEKVVQRVKDEIQMQQVIDQFEETKFNLIKSREDMVKFLIFVFGFWIGFIVTLIGVKISGGLC